MRSLILCLAFLICLRVPAQPTLEESYARVAELTEQENYSEALALVNNLLKEIPDELSLRYTRAVCYFNLKRFADAAADFRVLAVFAPENSEYAFQAANSYENLDSLSLAIHFYSQAIDQEPDNYLYYFKRATVYLKQSDWRKADADLSRSLTLNEHYANAYHNRGIARYKLGEEWRACNDWCTAMIKGQQLSIEHLEKNCRRYPFNCKSK